MEYSGEQRMYEEARQREFVANMEKDAKADEEIDVRRLLIGMAEVVGRMATRIRDLEEENNTLRSQVMMGGQSESR